jgi:hypothetical protein
MKYRSYWLKDWSDRIVDTSKANDRPMDSAKLYKLQLEAAGFKNVVEKRYKWPLNRWPKDPKLKKLGTSVVILIYFGPLIHSRTCFIYR